MKIAKVIIDGKTRQVDKGFSYLVPEELEKEVTVGVRVRVPFGAGNRHEIGFVIKIEECTGNERLKYIAEVMDDMSLFDREKLLEAFWIKNRYFSTFSEAIKLFLPPGSGAKLTEWIYLCKKDGHFETGEKKIIDLLEENGGVSSFESIKEVVGEKTRHLINSLLHKGNITVSHTAEKKIGVRRMRVVRFAEEPKKKVSEAALRAIRIMKECDCLSVADLCLFASCSASTVRTLIQKGVLIAEEIEVSRSSTKNRIAENMPEIILNEEQMAAASAIIHHSVKPFSPMLLHGVTGSGKTEVYLSVIDQVLQENGSAIVLVPEIALTHQMVSRFLRRFGQKTAVLHSGLSLGERHDEWLRINRGEASVVVGARSAIFAPCKNLKLIIIDEEHEDTYKSEMGVRYHARDVAMCRASTEGAKLLLASATPSVESYYYAQSGVYKLLEIKRRYNNASLPETYIVDMREEIEKGNSSPLSFSLQQELEQNTENKEQSILFLNRRGYSTFVSCRNCGYVEECPHCSISLTYHSFSESMHCHYCGYRKKVSAMCPECGSSKLHGHGAGTQKIEEYVDEMFPDANVLRMDVDTTQKKEAHEKILARFKNENIPILLGTQMIAKGLDFPNVTLVGVLNADQILNMGDYKSAERTFNLITQVSGRAGRGEKKGRTVIQTYSPESTVIQAAAKHDYSAFYNEEIVIRKALCYPPFCDIVNVMIAGKDEQKVKNGANVFYKKAENKFGRDVQLFRAAPCGINKINNIYRWHVWMKCKLNKTLASQIAEIVEEEKNLTIIVDVNPSSM